MFQAKAIVVKGGTCYVHRLEALEQQLVEQDAASKASFEVS